jgi:hypothetical protein
MSGGVLVSRSAGPASSIPASAFSKRASQGTRRADDDRLKHEGTIDKASGKAKETIDKAAHKAEDLTDDE